MAAIIQIRGGTAAQWTTVNPVLADRELGVETDTLKLKIGNGVDAWNLLPYAYSFITLADASEIARGIVEAAPLYGNASRFDFGGTGAMLVCKTFAFKKL